MNLFTEQINNWEDWGRVFQSIPAFTLLIEHIFDKENLPAAKIENLTPGTNAVFKVGDYVIKIFAPPEFSIDEDYGTNVDVELFGMKLANNQGVPSPKLIAFGTIEDKYYFRYMIMEYIHGKLLGEIEDKLSYEDKLNIGKQVRSITDKLNVPCENFTDIDVMQYAKDNNGWKDEGFPDSFQAERLSYLDSLCISQQDKVYCHSDFHCENILVDDNLNIYLIDFADAMFAPAEYEQAYIASALFCFEKPYMTGYFGEYDVEDIVYLCMTWLPVHAWGHSTAEGNLESVDDISSFAVMRERLRKLIKSEIVSNSEDSNGCK
jgi:serine/threonine protein kinase